MEELDATDEIDSDLQTAKRDFRQMEAIYYKVIHCIYNLSLSFLTGRRVFAKGPMLANKVELRKGSMMDIATESIME